MGILFAILLIVALILLERFSNKFHEEGTFLNDKIKPYHRKISDLLSPYRSTDFSKGAMTHSQKILKELLNAYESFSSQGTLRDDDICKIVIDSYNDKTIIECFSLMYLISYSPCSPIRQSDEEIAAIKSLKFFCENRLNKIIEDVPDCFWYEFELDKKKFDKSIREREKFEN